MSCEYNKESCPCKRLQCEYYGDCEACKEHHRTVETKYKIACERIAERNAKRREAYAKKKAMKEKNSKNK